MTTLPPGATINLLSRVRLNGAVPKAAQVSISFTTEFPSLLTQTDGVLKLSGSATPGSRLGGFYSVCTLTGSAATSRCAESSVSLTVGAAGAAPAAPIIGTATAANNTTIVHFTAPSDRGSHPITSYTATASQPGTFGLLTMTDTGSPIQFSGMTNGVAYTFTVTATNAAGTSAPSAASNSVTPAPNPPHEPNIGIAFPGDTVALVDFGPSPADGGAPVLHFTATSSPGGITATDVDAPILVTGLTNGVSYTFTVTATSYAGTSIPSLASNAVTPSLLPSPPTITSVVATSATTLRVTFSAPVFGAPFTGFTVTAHQPDLFGPGSTFNALGAASPIDVTVANTLNAHTISVTATNASGTSAPSASCNTGGPPPCP